MLKEGIGSVFKVVPSARNDEKRKPIPDESGKRRAERGKAKLERKGYKLKETFREKSQPSKLS